LVHESYEEFMYRRDSDREACQRKDLISNIHMRALQISHTNIIYNTPTHAAQSNESCPAGQKSWRWKWLGTP